MTSQTLTYLELNDWQIRAIKLSGELMQSSCAAALYDGRQLIFGEEALRRGRSEPQRFNNKYLYGVSADPLAIDMGPAKNQADLIYHHLKSLELADAEVVLGIPGHFSNEQLGLLLGICTEVGIKLRGFVEIPLAHSLNTPVSRDYLVIDVETHRFALTQINVDGSVRSCANSASLDTVNGISGVLERWMTVVADEMVRTTRFDPLHTGKTEQAVYDQVRGWLGSTTLTDRTIVVDQGGSVREQTVTAGALNERLVTQLDMLDMPSHLPIVATARVLSIPGLREYCSGCGITLLEAHTDDDTRGLATNVAQLSNHLRSGEVTRVNTGESTVRRTHGQSRSAKAEHTDQIGHATSDAPHDGLPNGEPARERPNHTAGAQAATPPDQDDDAPGTVAPFAGRTTQATSATHLLSQYHAYAFSASRFDGYLDPKTGAVIDPSVVINGVRSVGSIPAPGDELRIGDRRYIAIKLGQLE